MLFFSGRKKCSPILWNFTVFDIGSEFWQLLLRTVPSLASQCPTGSIGIRWRRRLDRHLTSRCLPMTLRRWRFAGIWRWRELGCSSSCRILITPLSRSFHFVMQERTHLSLKRLLFVPGLRIHIRNRIDPNPFDLRDHGSVCGYLFRSPIQSKRCILISKKDQFRAFLFDSFNQGCGSAFISSGSRSSILGWTPIRIQGFNDQKLKKNYSWKKIIFFISKTAFYYP